MMKKREMPENVKQLLIDVAETYNESALMAIDLVKKEAAESLAFAKADLLRRIEDGSCGFCSTCGEEIDCKRMLDNPYSKHCQAHETPDETVIAGFLKAVKDYRDACKRYDHLNGGDVDSQVSTASHIADVDTSIINDRTVALRHKDTCWLVVLQYLGALQRLMKGVYGICIKCHEEISEAQLRAKPERHACVECLSS